MHPVTMIVLIALLIAGAYELTQSKGELPPTEPKIIRKIFDAESPSPTECFIVIDYRGEPTGISCLGIVD